jgi:transposase
LLPVEIGAATLSGSEAARQSRAAASSRRAKSGMIEIELGSGRRVRVDSDVDAEALRRVLSVLSER